MNNQIVTIVGAGPTGLSLASFLRNYGISCIVLEKNSTLSNRSKAIVMHASTLEQMDTINLATNFIDKGRKLTSLNLQTPNNHNYTIEVEKFGKDLSKFPFVLIIEQSKTEEVLLQHLESVNCPVLFDHEVIGIQEFDEYVEVTVTHQNQIYTFITQYLIGSDGAHSSIREFMNITIEGESLDEYFYVADFEPNENFEKPAPYTGSIKFTNSTFRICLAFENGVYRYIGQVPKELQQENEVTFETIYNTIHQNPRLYHDTIHQTNWFSLYHVKSKVASKFMTKRCILAGDAAHTHSPAGGRGMNAGIQDSVNLAWKLAYSILYPTNDFKILASYDEERRQNAHHLIATTDQFFYTMTRNNWLSNLMKNLLIPLVFKSINSSTASKKIFPSIAMLDVKYAENSLISKSKLGTLEAGQRLPYFDNCEQLLKGLNFKLVYFGETSLDLLTTNIYEKIDCFIIESIPKMFEGVTDFYILLRPDGVISYIGKETNQLQELIESLQLA
jgi:2-polyprenyl-6-methoxyphenol hydroxylase-like FAD-dependent oxidoreductase